MIVEKHLSMLNDCARQAAFRWMVWQHRVGKLGSARLLPEQWQPLNLTMPSESVRQACANYFFQEPFLGKMQGHILPFIYLTCLKQSINQGNDIQSNYIHNGFVPIRSTWSVKTVSRDNVDFGTRHSTLCFVRICVTPWRCCVCFSSKNEYKKTNQI